MEPKIIGTQRTDTAVYLSQLNLLIRFCKLAASKQKLTNKRTEF
jgi:hypothetical protein